MMKNNENPQAIFLKDYQAPDYWIDKTELKFYLYKEFTVVKSRLRIRLNTDKNSLPQKVPCEGLPDLVLNGVALKLNAIQVNGSDLSIEHYQQEREHLSIQVNQIDFELSIETEIKPQENTTLEGLYVSKDMYCTQCEAHGFRRITYYLDRPDVMSVFDVYIEADQVKYPILLSNGNALQKGQLANGRHWAKWNDPHLKPCYLFALVAGDLACVKSDFIRASGKPVSLELFVESHDLDKCDYAIESLKNAMRWDEKVFGREYDLDVYMIVAVNHFNMGAMENKGLNIFNTSCVLAHPSTTSDTGFERVEGVVAHEYFHNWSGNRVTCRDWFQLSLKEGFTVFRDEEFSSDMGSRTVKRIDDVNILRNFQFKEDAGPMAHSIRPESYIEMNNFYTVTVYNKGAEVVRMLHTLLGEKKFRQACDLYFDKFDGQAVTCDDFVACMEAIAAQDFTQFKLWYSQAGTPNVDVSSDYDSKLKRFTLSMKQSCAPTLGQIDKLPFVIPISVALFSAHGEKLNFSFDHKNQSSEVLLQLNAFEQSFIFNDVQEDPIPSLLRNFTAPVKLNYCYSMSDLALLMANDDDGFNAWDAGQSLFLSVLKTLVESVKNDQELVLDQQLLSALQSLLKQAVNDELLDDKDTVNKSSFDKALLTRMLTLPSQAYLAEHYEVIDVDAIVVAHEFLERQIATQLHDFFEILYHKNKQTEDYEPSALQTAQRSLKNICLRYLSLSEHDAHRFIALSLADKQYYAANNMTDQSAAFRVILLSGALKRIPDCVPTSVSGIVLDNVSHSVNNGTVNDLSTIMNENINSNEEHRQIIIDDFYQRWQREALVIDQWFSMQTLGSHDSLLAEVQSLLLHDKFDFENPNRVRALLGAFSQNYALFHRVDGLGYAFYAEQIKALNAINPQIAARLVGALIHWKRYSGKRRELMKEQLEMLKGLTELSKDVFEIVTRALD